jgi:2-polyprenyl-3-methyl-5-hydroxy-6-metoxy-1,4-benzoquinol methylase
VWDDDARARLRSWGVDDRRITVLPNPMTPLLRQKSQWLDKKAVRRKLRLEENQPIAFFAAQPFTGLSALDDPSQVNETLYRILDLACLIPEFYFIVKFHPNDAHRGKPERMRRFIEEQTLPNVRLLVSEDSHELILASDVVISGTSTCLWEATVLDRVAVAFVNQEYTRQLFPYNSNSGVIRTDNIKELMKILRDVARRKENPSMIASRAPIKPAYSNSKCSGYFDDPRWEVFSLIPPKAKTLLDIGCGAGWLGEKIKATRQCFIVGVEKDREAGKRANQILDAVFIQDIEKFPLPFRERSFDCIVISDLLEHLVDPWETLRRLVGLLSDDGVVIISIPNIGHYTTLLSLIAGHFEYKDEGILDRTHLRFFTHEGIKNLLERSGLGLIKMLRNTHAGRKMRVANLLLGNRLADLITFQYLIVAERGDKKIANRCIIHQCALS